MELLDNDEYWDNLDIKNEREVEDEENEMK